MLICTDRCWVVQGAFPETHETFIGTYWGLVSTPCTAEIVESASAYIIVGPLFNDYNTVAFTLLLDESACLAHAASASLSEWLTLVCLTIVGKGVSG